MRIVHVITRMILGGAQENTLATAKGQAARHEVTLVTGPETGSEGTLLPEAEAAGIRVVVEPCLVRDLHPWKDFRALFRLARTIRALGPDVVHTHSSKAGVLGRLAAFRACVPVVVHTIHGHSFHPFQARWRVRLFRAIERRLARRTSRLIVVAGCLVGQARDAGVGREGQFDTIYSGFDVEAFRCPPASARAEVRASLGIPPGAFVFGTVGRFAEQKRHDLLLEAVAKVAARRPDARFLWVGDGPLRDRLQSQIARMGLSDRISIAGLVPRARVPAMLAAMDAIAHAALWEGLPRAVAQALAAGLPVTAFDTDGVAEVVRNGETGWLVPAGDVSALAERCLRLIGDPAEARRMGLAGQAWVVPRFGEAEMVRRIEAVYDELLASAGRPEPIIPA